MPETLEDLLGPWPPELLESFDREMRAIAEAERKAQILSHQVWLRGT